MAGFAIISAAFTSILIWYVQRYQQLKERKEYYANPTSQIKMDEEK